MSLPLHEGMASTAQPPDSAPKRLEASLAVGAYHSPDFPGSRTGSTLPLLDFSLVWRPKDWGVWTFNGMGFMWSPCEHPAGGVGIVVRGDLGRSEQKAAFLKPGSTRLKGLGEIDPTPEVGLMGSLNLGSLRLLGEVRRATCGHRGSVAEVGFEVGGRLSDAIGIGLSSMAQWGDGSTNQAYFGITPAQSARSAYAPYVAQAGWRKVSATLGVTISLPHAVFIRGGAEGARWIGPAAKSPIMENRNQLSTFAMVGYAF